MIETVEGKTRYKYRCRKCRKDLEINDCIITDVEGCDATEGTVWYLSEENPPDWITILLEKEGWVKGRLTCPKCRGKLGSFDFVSLQRCPCGEHNLPPLHVVKDRVDAIALLAGTSSRPCSSGTQETRQLVDRNRELSVFSGQTSSTALAWGQKATLDNQPMDTKSVMTDGESVNCVVQEQGVHFAQGRKSRQKRLLSEQFGERSLGESADTVRHRRNSFTMADLDYIHTCIHGFDEELTSWVQEDTTGAERGTRCFDETVQPGALQFAASSWEPRNTYKRSASEQQERVLETAHRERLVRNISDNPFTVLQTSTELDGSPESIAQVSESRQRKRKRVRKRSAGEKRVEEEKSVPAESVCPICLEVLYKPHACLPCLHVFCEPCLRQLARLKPINTPCPLCRISIMNCQADSYLANHLRETYPHSYKSREQEHRKVGKCYYPLPHAAFDMYDVGSGLNQHWNRGQSHQFFVGFAALVHWAFCKSYKWCLLALFTIVLHAVLQGSKTVE